MKKKVFLSRTIFIAFAFILIFSMSAYGASAAIHLEAEDRSSTKGTSWKPGETMVGGCDNGDWLRFKEVDFGTGGYTTFVTNMGVPDEYAGSVVEVRLDTYDGKLMGSLVTKSTGDWDTIKEQSVEIKDITGVQNVVILFQAGPDKSFSGVGNFDWFEFRKPSEAAPEKDSGKADKAEASAPAKDTGSESPKTGDSGILLFAAAAIASASTGFTLLRKRK